MPTDDTQAILDKAAIGQLIAAWGILRDTYAWEKLRDCWTDDGRIAVSWFDGTADEFVAGCKPMAVDRDNQIASQHVITGGSIDVAGDRAVAETRILILVRLKVDGIWSDVTAVARFYDLLLRTTAGWKIRRRVAIFDKDFIAPANPSDRLELDQARLEIYPEAYRCCGYMLSQRGMEINMDLPAPGSPALDRLYAEGADWLAGT
ncbi:nuclear transport factor 2 family protein [Sphingomonas sp. CGMCC 1.13654]|uniref:Nuclear transport factor 2 family protein n=1 Tax=Sphingomonas chungangi TaxID=2683589 RepID=A0A838L336_9SPHN|nr:nuclear transport factor 2 family protein [Sphingomonas chungangi]MBA2933477.1 nuclear transport factor 2 family protein [Sphingomonas chungangi]